MGILDISTFKPCDLQPLKLAVHMLVNMEKSSSSLFENCRWAEALKGRKQGDLNKLARPYLHFCYVTAYDIFC